MIGLAPGSSTQPVENRSQARKMHKNGEQAASDSVHLIALSSLDNRTSYSMAASARAMTFGSLAITRK
jgi:hypothetical protein